MHVELLTHHLDTGWSRALPATLDGDDTLVLAFAAREYFEAPLPLADLRAAFPRAKILGCSTAGEIHGGEVRDRSLSIAVARFEHTRLASRALAVGDASRSFEAGRELAAGLARPDLRSILVLSDGLGVNGSELVRGVNSAVGPDVVVTGGLAGDGSAFERTFVLDGARPVSGWISAVAFYGDRIHVGHGVEGGLDHFGPERRITRSKGNVLYELDGKPALALYKQYLGERAQGLPATALHFPLEVRPDAQAVDALVRTVLAVDEAEQSMTFAGDVAEGSLARLMRTNADHLVEGASRAAIEAHAPETSSLLSIAISCVGRRLVLGVRTEEELEAVLDELPDGTQLVGFYSYGELAPHAGSACELHNQTMTLTTIREV